MQTVLFELRTAELFDIIVMYPDGNPALEDLKVILENQSWHSTFVLTVCEFTGMPFVKQGREKSPFGAKFD